jgi:hypothetical protein
MFSALATLRRSDFIDCGFTCLNGFRPPGCKSTIPHAIRRDRWPATSSGLASAAQMTGEFSCFCCPFQIKARSTRQTNAFGWRIEEACGPYRERYCSCAGGVDRRKNVSRYLDAMPFDDDGKLRKQSFVSDARHRKLPATDDLSPSPASVAKFEKRSRR